MGIKQIFDEKTSGGRVRLAAMRAGVSARGSWGKGGVFTALDYGTNARGGIGAGAKAG
jgi:hypothetical protein